VPGATRQKGRLHFTQVAYGGGDIAGCAGSAHVHTQWFVEPEQSLQLGVQREDIVVCEKCDLRLEQEPRRVGWANMG
jgi:hypothetical protein